VFAPLQSTKAGPSPDGAKSKTGDRQSSEQSRKFAGSPIQSKLQAGTPDDHVERETDGISESAISGGAISRMPVSKPGVQRRCAARDEEETKDATLIRKADSSASIGPSHASGRAASAFDGDLTRVPLFSSKGRESHAKSAVYGADSTLARSAMRLRTAAGQQLDPEIRRAFEARFGMSLGDARIHAGPEADTTSQALDARAFAIGGNVGFRAGYYQPGSAAGRALLAHELTHVAQFARAGATWPAPPDVKVSDESHPLEGDARGVAMQEARGDDWRYTPAAARAGTIFRQPAAAPAPAPPKPAEHLLADDENFKWIGAVNAPVIVIRTGWLIKKVGVSPRARTVDGSAHPKFMRAVLSALIDRYPWAAAEREHALKDVRSLSIILGADWAKDDEQQIPLSQTVFLRIGMPPEAPIQVYPSKSGVEIYFDLRHFIPPDAKPDALDALKAAVAERITAALETYAKQPMPAGMRLYFVGRLQKRLKSTRETVVIPLSEADLRTLFGERGWNAALAGREAEEGTGPGAVFAVAGGGYVLPSDLSATDRETVTGLLTRIFGGAPSNAPAPQQPLVLGHLDVQKLLELAKQPAAFRDKIIARIQRGRHAANLDKPQSVSDLVEIATAQGDIEQSAAQVGYKLPEKVTDIVPIASRPVHGRILNKSGALVPGMKGKFEFETLDQVDALRVPHVDIQWYAVKAGAPANTSPVASERTSYMELYEDGLFNDREFTATFDKIGNYDIHAFVNHNFYLPAHFTIPVEVKTEHARLLEQEQESGAGAFGKATGPAKPYKFADVEAQAEGIQTIIDIATGVGGAALGSTSQHLKFSVPELSEEETTGLRTEGTLSAETFGTPGGSLASSRRTIQQEVDSLNRLITQYGATGGSDDMKEWAIARRDRLVATREKLDEISGGTDNKPIAVQGTYVTRTAGQRSGALKLAAWFTWEPDASGNGGTYHGHLFDHSEIVRTEDFHFRASDSSYERMMEGLFFDLSRTYPNGTMSFWFQVYDGLKASRRFIRLERVTDTPLQDVRDVMFSEPVSIIVNIAAAILTIFPPTAPLGIAISLAYNGLNAGLNMADAMRTDTVHASNYIDIGLVALDIIPLLGKASKVLKIGNAGYRVLSAGQHAGMMYMFTESTYLQVRQLRDGMVTDVAKLRDEIATLEATNPSDPRLAAKKREAKDLEDRIRSAAADIFTEAALHQGLTMAAQHAITRAVAAHVEGGSGSRPGNEEQEGRPHPGDEGRHDAAEPEGEPGIVRAHDEAVRGGGARPASDPVLSRALPVDLRGNVPVLRGPPPEAHGVEVHYRTDALGLITDVEIRAGPTAVPAQIEQHIGVVRTMQRYKGIGGRIRILFERLRALVGRRGAFVPGSALFEASLEVEKLPAIIAERAEQLSRHGLDPDVRRDLEADLDHLQKELARHERTVAEGEEEAGVGFVAQTVPKSNAGAIASGYPALEGVNAAPGHYYYRTAAGTYELRRFKDSMEPPKQLARVTEGGKQVWRVVDRPEEPRGFKSFLEMQRANFPEPLTDNPHLEDALARRFAGNATDQGGAAIARRWGEALKRLHDGAGAGGTALLDRLLDNLGAATTDTTYGKFRREVRSAMVDQAMAAATPQAQVQRIRELMATLPDSRSQGEVFTDFREKLASGKESPISYMQPIGGAETRLGNDRIADGAVNITAAQRGGPPAGRYLVEDKSGPGAFKADQAKAYHGQLQNGANVISTVNGEQYKGVLYTFDTEQSARAAMSTLGDLNKNIHVGFFDARGQFVWLR